MGMVVRPRTILRGATAIKRNAGEVLLDRGATSAFSRSATFIGAVGNLNCSMLRWATTGHDNLPKFHPFALIHTYGAGTIANPGAIYSTQVAGNSWDPTYDLSWGGVRSEVMGPDDFGALWRALGGIHDVHLFFDWQNGVSEGRLNPDGSGTFDWYVDPYAKDINGNTIPAGTLALMRSPDFKKLENRRFLKNIIEVQGIAPEKIIINMGGEDWRGWNPPFPWPLPDKNQNQQYAYFAAQVKIYLTDLLQFATEQGWRSKLRTCVGFLESVEGGAPIPLLPSTIKRDLEHFLAELKEVGPLVSHMSCSMHYRGTWDRYLTEDELQLSWFTPSGQGSFKEIFDYFRSLVSGNGFPTIDLIQMAGSVGDARNEEGKIAGDVEPMTQEQCGMAAFQYQAELIKAGCTLSDAYGGLWGDWPSGQGTSGVTGAWHDDLGAPQPFTIWPQYYAKKMMNDVLVRDAELVEFISPETQLPTIAFKWNDGEQTIVSLFVQNKRDATRVLPIEISQVQGASVRQAQRYSFTETTAPVVSGAASLAGNMLTVTANPISITRVDLVVTPGDYNSWAQEIIDTVFDEFSRPGIYEANVEGGGFAEPIDVAVLPTRRERELGAFNATSLLSGENAVEIRLTEIAAPKKGDRLTVDGVAYTILVDPLRRDRFGLVWQVGLKAERRFQ
jgi:hypothetical protein